MQEAQELQGVFFVSVSGRCLYIMMRVFALSIKEFLMNSDLKKFEELMKTDPAFQEKLREAAESAV